MKLILNLLPLAVFASAFVIPDKQIIEQLMIEKQDSRPSWLDFDGIQDSVEDIWSGVEVAFKDTAAFADRVFDKAISATSDTAHKANGIFDSHLAMEKWDIRSWLDSPIDTIEDDEFNANRPHKKPDHGHHGHHDPANRTVYELITSSKHTTMLTKLINEYPDLVETLNSTAANYTIFAPTDNAFRKLPKHSKKPSKELIKKVLDYHISPEVFTTGRILASHTIPTSLKEDSLGSQAQRLRVSLSLRGLSVNFFSRIVASNFIGTNGVVHAVDSVILPPPTALQIIKLFPSEFSTFQLGLTNTGLSETFAESYHEGGTFFAPSNFAFRKLGVKINAFLFSKHGEKYLKALLKYHVVANQTLYSDAFYKTKVADGNAIGIADDTLTQDTPKGFFHVDLPTLLDDKSLSIDLARYGGLINMKINGYSNVAVQDGISKDGVIHTVNSVLIPPKTPGGTPYLGEEINVGEFKARFNAYIEEL